MAWDLTDVALAASLVAGAALSVAFVLRHRRGSAWWPLAVLAVVGVWALVWANLAVGIVGGPGNPVSVALIGATALASGWFIRRAAS